MRRIAVAAIGLVLAVGCGASSTLDCSHTCATDADCTQAGQDCKLGICVDTGVDASRCPHSSAASGGGSSGVSSSSSAASSTGSSSGGSSSGGSSSGGSSGGACVENDALNPDFESDTQSWTLDGSQGGNKFRPELQRSTAFAVTGNWSGHFSVQQSCGQDSGCQGTLSTATAATAGQVFTASAILDLDQIQGTDTVGLRIAFYSGASLLGASALTTSSTVGVQSLTTVGTAPAGSTTAVLQLQVQVARNDLIDFYFDAVALRPGACGTPGVAAVPGVPGHLIVETLAGQGDAGFNDANGRSALFAGPAGLALRGESLFIAEESNERIRVLDLQSQQVTTVAGNGVAGFRDGPAQGPQSVVGELSSPARVAFDAAGDLLIADNNNYRVRVLDAQGNLGTLAGNGVNGFRDGAASDAEFGPTLGLALDAQGRVYAVDQGNNLVRRVSAGAVTTFAGDGGVALSGPSDLAFQPSGELLISDTGHHQIAEADAAGNVRVFAGSGATGSADGTLTTALFNAPKGLVVGPGGAIYVADQTANTLRRIDAAGNVVTLAGNPAALAGGRDGVAGNDGPARLNGPLGLVRGPQGYLYFSDASGNQIRVLRPAY